MILIFNPGSTSIKFKLFDENDDLSCVASGSENNIDCKTGDNYSRAIQKIIGNIKSLNRKIDIVGYRIVHGGDELKNGAVANKSNLEVLEKYSAFAPLHNPPALKVIRAVEPNFGRAKHLLYFDTDFFSSLPEEETTYPLPHELCNELGIKKYGFHGISHKYALSKVDPENHGKIITIHLGAGCSIAAIDCGKPIATTFGFTPDEGLMMQTRTGDIDPGIVLYLAEKYGTDKAKTIIENDSGLSGVTGTDGSMLNVLYLAGLPVEDPEYSSHINRTAELKRLSELALKMYINRVVKYVSYYTTLLGKADKLIFTGKIGAGSSVIREMVKNIIDNLPIDEFVCVEPNEELAIAQEILSNYE